jgi:hypothetical protein
LVVAQLIDDPPRERIVAADDDVIAHVQTLLPIPGRVRIGAGSRRNRNPAPPRN